MLYLAGVMSNFSVLCTFVRGFECGWLHVIVLSGCRRNAPFRIFP